MYKKTILKYKNRKLRKYNKEKVTDKLGEIVRVKFLQFLKTFTLKSDNPKIQKKKEGGPYYVNKLKDRILFDDYLIVLYVDFSHLGQVEDLQKFIASQYMRARSFLHHAIKDLAKEYLDYLNKNENNQHLKINLQKKEFQVGFYNMNLDLKLRDLKTDKVGQLSAVSGTVTRTSEVRPELIKGTFKCDDCNAIIRNVVQQFKFTLPTKCLRKDCHNKRNFTLKIRDSKFSDWQRIRIQENAEDIPSGSIPRSIDVILRDDVVEKCKPGDKCIFTGSIIPVPSINQNILRGIKLVRSNNLNDVSSNNPDLKTFRIRSLNCKLFFLACSCQFSHVAYSGINLLKHDVVDFGLTEEEKHEILMMKSSETPGIYIKLVKSIAPNVFGHEEIKRGILLMLFGGIHKKTKDHIKLRGDINICIIGDPSTAKSQFLKFVTRLTPRTVYTSGKGSTAAGLTAAVKKNAETGEMGIEAGALMLADNGICCIDEFDKMDEKDQAAIHEAMEQQTITITKSGIQASLNARTSILAAANPCMGRYDPTRPLKANVSLSSPIMSRFDLFFIVLDECDEQVDGLIARHMLNLHQAKKVRKKKSTFTVVQIQNYIRFARMIKPKMLKESKGLLILFYRQYRRQEVRKAYKFTVRQLESMIRISEALAKIHLDEEIKPNYVREAARLLMQSIVTIDDGFIQDEIIGQDLEIDEKKRSNMNICLNYAQYRKIATNIICHCINNDEGYGTDTFVNTF